MLLIWHPRFVDLIGGFHESVTCYYADDEFSSFAGLSDRDRNQILEQEDDLLRKVDLVFVSGPALMEKKNRYGNAINVPMGADFELFSRSRRRRRWCRRIWRQCRIRGSGISGC